MEETKGKIVIPKKEYPGLNAIAGWFVGLPIWIELDNYFYFTIAIYVLNMCSDSVDDKAFYGFVGAIIAAALMKGKGK